MKEFIGDYFFLIISVILLCITVFKLIAILRGTAVIAQRTGYEEREDNDPSGKSFYPIYRFSLNGATKSYVSRFPVGIFFLRSNKDTARIYITRKGKVIEKQSVILSFVVSVIFFYIYMLWCCG